MPSTKSNDSLPIRWLATLRGIFVLLVFISHQFTSVLGKEVLLSIGKVGVAGFFLISGYLAMTSIERRNIKQFLFNRFVRLYPVYWILLFLMVASTVFTHGRMWNVKEVVANMTFFHQYMGIDNIIGASWMLSIMVIFFVSLVLILKKTTRVQLLYFFFAVGAIVCGFMRFYFQKPFPTAIFLMTCMGFFGYFYHKYDICRKNVWNIIVFEVSLLVSGYLSYQEMLPYYEISYNGALVLFFLFCRRNIGIRAFDKLGQLGFTFFLGAGIPKVLLSYYFPLLRENFWLFLLIHFAVCIVFSFLVTKFVENPIVQGAKKLEWRLGR